ncbi:Protein kinase, ATP binding site-containing protein [Artemisia annua]|uniref:Protein kinase, ATP binding site-containing protein n=1 Tax=Artemisia annua TaxID=35608 RepID=A0A2U1KV07_ARTAN|nr:Protein kinase, ATP binding site-containing protein [Artemisia annua]
MSSSSFRLEDEGLLIPLEEIRSATKDFNKETLIREGEFGKVYKGQFTERLRNCTAAVKRYKQRRHFLDELNLISKLHHENIIPFIGYFENEFEKIIVSEYAIKGSLKDHLRDPNKRLSMTWPQRLKICLGAAKAINYLHMGLRKDYVVIHRNIRSSAIFLDENLEAKIGSFAKSVEVGRNQQHIYEEVVGTSYYIDPIYQESGILEKEADVYTFGVVMFELLSETLADHQMTIGDDKPLPLITLVRRYYNIDGLDKLIDSQIRGQTDRRSLDTFKEIAYRCISYSLNDRPSIDRIVKRITEALDIHGELADRNLNPTQDDRPLTCPLTPLSFYCQNNAAASTITIRSHLHHNLEHLRIPLEEIRLATNDFSQENVTGIGRFGSVYKGQLSGRWENRTAAFKQHDLKRYEQDAKFRNYLQMMSRLRHENIIQLIGYCDEGGVIVYDYAVNGSLDSYLANVYLWKRRSLTWAQRLKICIGATRGLKHLQASHGEDKILVHRNFNSKIILLDDNMEPLISGFGFSVVVDRNKGQVYDIPVGANDYIDPIYRESGIIKSETDVYSLGVVLFEMLSGMPAWKRRTGNDKLQPLIKLVRRHIYDAGVIKLIDPLIKDKVDIRSFLIFKEIASKCISLNLKDRPSLSRIIKRLEEALRIQDQGDASTIATRSQLSHQDKKLEDFRIPLEEIRLATEDFREKIGEGGFGDVYKGQLSKSWQNCTAAIKRQNRKGHQGKEEFRNELELIFKFRHQNIINFLGYCDENSEMIIVNEYASNGSLDGYLEDTHKRRNLTWVQRLRICIGAAQGLDYLHWGLGEKNRVIHRDVKSGNILLDDKLEAKICDFGLSKSGPTDKPQSKLYTKAAGTRFYMDPLYQESGMLQKESDVYSLGVVLFEMLTGMLAYYEMAIEKGDEPQFLINLVRRYFDDGLDMLVDRFIKDDMDRRSFHTFKYVAYECISLNSKDRPTIDTIIDKLQEALEFQVIQTQ